MEQEYIYYAFVSYSHKDKGWAEWIWNAIEHYRLPAVIRKEVQKPLPKKMRPVFLDKADLGAGVLEENLRDELVASRYLVVVCSPNSARPNEQGEHFVDTEVRHFCEMGRKEKVIPVLVEGTPEESFCPKIKEVGLKAINATELPRAVHSGSLAAGMGVRVGDIVCRLDVDDWQLSPTACNPSFCAQATDLHVNEPYDIMSTREVRGFRSLLHGGQNRGKELVIARRNGDAYEMFSYSFPGGQMGFCVAYGDVRDYVELEASYKAYCESEKGEKK